MLILSVGVLLCKTPAEAKETPASVPPEAFRILADFYPKALETAVSR